MVTLEDLAKVAGVSHSTVSRALADSPLVNQATKARIQSLALEAGYQVNQVARNLKTRSTRTIGLVVPEVSNPYYPKVIQQVADRVREAGYSLQLQLSGMNQESESICLARLQEQRVDGVLLVTGERGLVGRDQLNSLTRSGTPVILMGWVSDSESMDMVMGDDAAGGYHLAQHLISLGHKNMALVGKTAHRGELDRIFGFRKALSEAGLALDEQHEVFAVTDEQVKAGIAKLLSLSQPPTAIFAYQDSLAALVYKHLQDAGVHIPTEMTVVGFDDLDLATYLSPRLTTVGGHIEPLSASFVSLLFDRVKNREEASTGQKVVVTPQVIVRSSCAPPRTGALGDNPS